MEFNKLFGKKLLFRPMEVADMLSLGLSTVYEKIDEGIFDVTRDVAGNKIKPVRILRKSIIRYLKQPDHK